MNNKSGLRPEKNMERRPSFQSLLALSWLILLISGLKAGIGPFLSIYLKSELQWNANQIGVALAMVNLAAMLNQVPGGLIIDAYKIKRLMLGISCIVITIGCIIIAHLPYFTVISAAQFIIGFAAAIIPQAIVAISLGLVGTNEFPRRQSTNEALSHASNILMTLIAGILAYYVGNIWILYTYAIFSLVGILPLLFIKGKDIDHDIARELAPIQLDNTDTKATALKTIVSSKVFLIFLASVFLYHFASAAQLPLIAQLFVQLKPKTYAIYMTNSILVSHLVMMLVTLLLRTFIIGIKRKPLFLLTFFFVFIRGILFGLFHNANYFVAVQILDGIGGGIFGVITVVMISELAARTGRFNFMIGLMAFCQGFAYATSNYISGFIANLFGFNVGFYSLSVFALVGFTLALLHMPETRRKSSYEL